MNEVLLTRARAKRILRATLQVSLMSLIGTVLLAVFSYVLTASSPLLGDIVLADAASFGANYWLVIFGADINIGTVKFSLIPTTLTLLTWLHLWLTLRKIELKTWVEALLAGVFQAGIISVLGLLLQNPGAWWTAIVGGFFFAVSAALLAGKTHLLIPYSNDFLSTSFQISKTLLTGFGALILVFSLGIVLLNFSKIMAVHALYYQSAVGDLGLLGIELLYLPTFLLWVVAWLCGAGFYIGEVSNFTSIFATDLGPLPGIPVFAVIPDNGFQASYLLGLPIVLACGLGIFLYRHHQVERQNANRYLVQVVLAGLIFVSIFAFGSALATGAVGPGNLGKVGVAPNLVVLWLLLIFVLPLVIVSFLLRYVKLGKQREPKAFNAVNVKETETETNLELETNPEPETELTITATLEQETQTDVAILSETTHEIVTESAIKTIESTQEAESETNLEPALETDLASVEETNLALTKEPEEDK